MRTTAIVYVLSFKLYLSGKLHWFFPQAGWAYDQVADFIKVFLWIGNEDIDTALAAESVFFATIGVSDSFIPADLQPHK